MPTTKVERPSFGLANPVALLPIHKPEAMHPDWIKLEDTKGDEGITMARGFLEKCQQKIDLFNTLRTKPNLSQTQDWNMARLINAIETEGSALYKDHTESRILLEQSRFNADAALETARDLKPDQFAIEVVAAMRAMSDQHRMATAQAAIEAGDKSTLAAILKAPVIATGLTPDQRTALQRLYDNKHCAAQVEKVRLIENCQKRLKMASEQIARIIVEAYGETPMESKVRQNYNEVMGSLKLAPAPHVS